MCLYVYSVMRVFETEVSPGGRLLAGPVAGIRIEIQQLQKIRKRTSASTQRHVRADCVDDRPISLIGDVIRDLGDISISRCPLFDWMIEHLATTVAMAVLRSPWSCHSWILEAFAM